MRASILLLCALALYAAVGAAACVDKQPPSGGTCAEQISYKPVGNKCHASWMTQGGFCKCSCAKYRGGSKHSGSHHSGGKHHSSGGGGGNLGINEPGNMQGSTYTPSLHSGDGTYAGNKAKFAHYVGNIAGGTHTALYRFLFAIAMAEGTAPPSSYTCFCPSQRDSSKDSASDGSNNLSLFNINLDFVQNFAGYHGNPSALNGWSGVGKAAALIKGYISKHGVNNFLNFQRGGRSGYQSPDSSCAEYRNGIATYMKAISANPALLTNNERFAVQIAHQ